MAEIFEVSQQTVNSYEVGRRRVPVSALPVLAKTLMMTMEDLVGEESQAAKKKREPIPKLRVIVKSGVWIKQQRSLIDPLLVNRL